MTFKQTYFLFSKISFILIFNFFCFAGNSQQNFDSLRAKALRVNKIQSFVPGDIILNVNYGAPQITPFILKSAIKLYNKNTTSTKYQFAVKNTGVLNAKIEYGVLDNLGLGLACSYWSMGVDLKDNYATTDPNTGSERNFTDNYNLSISALAIGIRGNYHFVDAIKAGIIDPYYGVTLGTTKYTYGLEFSSDYPDKASPDTYQLFKTGYASRLLKSGWSSYISTTFGARLFPVPYIGLNAEIGWDRGAFLFGGVVFKFHTRTVKSFVE